MKHAILLIYSIDDASGELAPKELVRTHNLSSLLELLDLNLCALKVIPTEPPLRAQTKDLIRDINNFGMLGEALRYPYHSVKSKTLNAMSGQKLPDELIPDVPRVIQQMKEASGEFSGLIGCLMEYEDSLYDY